MNYSFVITALLSAASLHTQITPHQSTSYQVMLAQRAEILSSPGSTLPLNLRTLDTELDSLLEQLNGLNQELITLSTH